MNFIKERKYTIIFAALALWSLIIIIVGLASVTVVSATKSYNAFAMLGAYLDIGANQGFISLATPVIIILTSVALLIMIIFWALAAIKNKPGKLLYGVMIAIIILQIIWALLMANYIAWKMEVFFDLSATSKLGGGYWFVLIGSIILLAGLIATSIFQKKWKKTKISIV